ncbi:MAG: hypothetical protein GY749_29595 [Desulfobacteraceae bacterium]|nr:hypothetical protein [Desulfobacteraceae bacterium]
MMIKKVLHLVMLIFFMCSSVIYASNKPAKYTINFPDNCTISDALKQIQAVTGVRLNVNADIREPVIRTSFHNSDIDQILKELLDKRDYAVVWNYNSNPSLNLPESIDVWFFEQGYENTRPITRKEETNPHLSIVKEEKTDTWSGLSEKDKKHIPALLDEEKRRAIMEGVPMDMPENPFPPNLFDIQE